MKPGVVRVTPILSRYSIAAAPAMTPPMQERHLDDPVAVDAHQRGGLGVLGDGADAAAEPGAAR